MGFRRLDRLVAEVMAQLENDMRVAREIGAAPAEWGTPEPLAQSGEEDARSGMGKNGRTTAPEVEREVIKPGDTTDGNLWIWTSLSTAYAQRMLSAVPVGTGRRRASRPTESPTPALRRPVLIVVGGMDHATSRSNGHSASLAVNSRHSSSV